jgi:hypothetical protein
LTTHDEEIPQQVGVDVLGATPHVILLEAADPFADGSLDLSLGSHGDFWLGSHRNGL